MQDLQPDLFMGRRVPVGDGGNAIPVERKPDPEPAPTLPTPVTRSFNGYAWRLADKNGAIANALIRKSIPSVLATLTASRAPADEDPYIWLNPSLKAMNPNPFRMKDAAKAAKLITDEILAIRSADDPWPVGIFGDYDVDGAGSTAIMALFLRALGVESHVRIPDRITEGYGPNMAGLRELTEKGSRLIIILDTGALAFDVLAEAAAEGMRIVVIDHHACEPRLPNALAVVNPNRLDDNSGYGYMCAGGLALMIAMGMRAVLKRSGFPEDQLPVLTNYLDLAALTTVADVAPLRGLNRAFVREGLAIASRGRNPGIAALTEESGISAPLHAEHFGFQLGPRINAGGRIGDTSLGASLLRSNDPDQCREIARNLGQLNGQRQSIERKCTAAAREDIERRDQGRGGGGLACALGAWHEGVIGISAGRLKDQFLRPTIVFSRTEGGLAKGSGRSVDGFDLGAAVIKAAKEGVLVRGGGHPAAAGMTIEESKLSAFMDFMDAEIARSAFAQDGVPLRYDMEIDAIEVTPALVKSFDRLEPFGQGNPKPRFLVRALTVVSQEVLKDVHVKMNFTDGHGRRWKAMAFNGVGAPLVEAVAAAMRAGKPIDLITKFKLNEWKGRISVELDIEDARISVGF